MDPSEFVEKALLVRNLGSLGSSLKISDDQLRDKLMIHFQNRKKSHGGDVREVIYPLSFDTDYAIVLFDDVKDRESAFRQEQVFHMQPLTVSRLPPVFTSIKAQIDPLYFKIMPLNVAGEFQARFQKMATVDKDNCSKISCSHPAQLERVEREVLHLVVSHEGTSPPTSMLSDDDDDERGAAGASNYDYQPTYPLQRSQGEFKDKVRGHEAAAERGTDRSYPEAPSEETEDPEEFFDTQSGDQKQHTTLGDLHYGPPMNYSSPVVQDKQTAEKVDDGNNADALQSVQDTGVVLNKYIYKFLKTFEDKALKQIFKRYNVELSFTPEKTGDDVKADVVASNSKATPDNMAEARDAFILFYQKAHMEIFRRTIDCSSVSRRNLDDAVKRTLRKYNTDTLITKVDGSPHLRLIVRHGDVEEVAREFRELAGIKSSRKLRAPSAGGEESKSRPITESHLSTHQYTSNTARDTLPPNEPQHSSLTTYSTFCSVSQNSRETSSDYPLQFVTNEGMNIAILQGDITNQNVHAIVNPSNSALSNIGGVAKAINSAAGFQLGTECGCILSRRGNQKFQMSECILTSGFNLKCKIIHAVVPATYPHRSFNVHLYNTFLNCLRTAEYNKLSSLAIPLIGSGSIGAPKQVCADALTLALLDFSHGCGVPKVVREVILVNIDPHSTTAIQQSLQTALSATRNAAFEVERTPGVKASTGAGFSKPASVDVRKPGLPSQSPPPPSGGQHSAAKVDDRKALNKDQQGSFCGNASSDAYGNGPGPQDSKTAVNTARPTGAQFDTLGAQTQASSADDKTNKCPICLSDTIEDEVVLEKCKHRFCKGCIEKALKSRYTCPVCNDVCRQPRGNQPEGNMTDSTDRYSHLPGYQNDGVITIRYNIPNGTQTADHPNPNSRFTGDYRIAYLPDNQEGREVLRLLRKAFDARLVFTVGKSVTSGLNNVVTWNDIHHKTSMSGGPSNHGYPDPGYLKRVTEDLAAKGIF